MVGMEGLAGDDALAVEELVVGDVVDVRVAGDVVLLLPMIWLVPTAPVPAASPANCWLLPPRSRMPVVPLPPKVTVELVGNALLAPKLRVPLAMVVPPP